MLDRNQFLQRILSCQQHFQTIEKLPNSSDFNMAAINFKKDELRQKSLLVFEMNKQILEKHLICWP